MAKKSRRLPGGKVRKPIARRNRGPVSLGTAVAPAPAEAADGAAAPRRPNGSAGRLPALEERPRGAAPSDRAPRPAPPTSRLPAGPRPPRPGAAPGTVSPGQVRGLATLRQSAATQRGGRSLMDLAAANYTHVRADLARIGILAIVMLAIIVALSFVLK